MRRPLGAAAALTLFDDGCPDEYHDLTKPEVHTNDRGDVLTYQWCRICGLNITKLTRAGEQ